MRGNRLEKTGDSASVGDQRGLWWGWSGSVTSERGNERERGVESYASL